MFVCAFFVLLALSAFSGDKTDAAPLAAELTNLNLSSTSGNDFTSDDLNVTYTLSGTATTAATAWYKNGSPLMALLMPFEGGAANALGDYSGNGQTATTIGRTSVERDRGVRWRRRV